MNKKLFFALIIVFGIAIIAFAYYTLSPFFITEEIYEDALGAPTAIQDREVIGTKGHRASGTASIFFNGEFHTLRYENFETINGPTLHVYLAKDLDAREYIDLGPAKGTKGDINYEIPEDIDITEYKYALYWCVPFRALFNYADIGVQ